MGDLVIAIDGPAASGKGTTARRVATDLGIPYFDTGAVYRACGAYLLIREMDIEDEIAVTKAVSAMEINVLSGEDSVFVNGVNMARHLRLENTGNAASVISQYKGVRDALFNVQKKQAEHAVVMDGRDIGTVIAPDADIKIYLDADPEVRAMRRMMETYKKTGQMPKHHQMLKEIKERDERDKNRENAPLMQADDAIYIDNSKMEKYGAAEIITGIARKMMNHVVGKDADGKKIRCGDICSFEISLERKAGSLEIEEMVGMVAYGENDYSYTFETLDDFAPSLYMSGAKAGTIRKLAGYGTGEFNKLFTEDEKKQWQGIYETYIL